MEQRPAAADIGGASTYGITAGKKLSASGCRHGSRMKVGQADTLTGQGVEIGRPYNGIAVPGKLGEPLIIRHDDDDIGVNTILFFRTAQEKEGVEGHAAKEE